MFNSSIRNFFKSEKPKQKPTEDISLLPPQNKGLTPLTPYSNPNNEWFYPNSKEKREYQFEISKTCLCYNTFVALPTGLGKTFIAAVVIYNYYKWFPQGKIMFLAPTKPLAEQQRQGISESIQVSDSELITLTGNVRPGIRKKLYQECKIFFLTPQTLENDIKNDIIEAQNIVLIIFDEAHKASGDYAYCNIVKLLDQQKIAFRIVALSATPASKKESIQQTLTNLNISKLMIKSDTDADIKRYIHEKDMKVVRVSKSSGLAFAEKQLNLVMMELGKQLRPFTHLGPMRLKPHSFNKKVVLDFYTVIQKSKQQIFEQIGSQNMSLMYGILGVLMSILNLRMYLQNHGLNTLNDQLDSFENGNNVKYPQIRQQVIQSNSYQQLRQIVNDAVKIGDDHPKIAKLCEILEKHFEQLPDSRVIVFTSYRSSVINIQTQLQNHTFSVKSEIFVGQQSYNNQAGLNQQQQLEVIQKFKEGIINTLISTQVGEEGLDIGEVDLIILFDSAQSSIRTIQRIGRTGRKKDGSVLILSTDRNEEAYHNRSMKNGNSLFVWMQKFEGELEYFQQSPRMIPDNIQQLFLHRSSTPSNLFKKKSRIKTGTVKQKKLSIVPAKQYSQQKLNFDIFDQEDLDLLEILAEDKSIIENYEHKRRNSRPVQPQKTLK